MATGACSIFGVGCSLVVLTLASSASGFAPTGISVEAVDDYAPCNQPPLANNQANVDGLYNNMTPVGGVSWIKQIHWLNGDVWDSDFYDPELLAGGTDGDTQDRPGDDIFMFSGHGICDNSSNQLCMTSATCNSPGAGQGLPGRCTKEPGLTWGHCMYYMPRKTITCGNNDIFGGFPDLSSGAVRYGDSPPTFGWAGAGTNGGINFVIQDISCGATPGEEASEFWNTFAGAHIISTIMPTNDMSDTGDVSNRGSTLAAHYRANVNGSPSIAWIDTMNSISGGTCAGGNGHGIYGCGAYISYSLAENQSWAEYLNGHESWKDMQNEANDTLGANYLAWVYECNYDCNRYPLYY